MGKLRGKGGGGGNTVLYKAQCSGSSHDYLGSEEPFYIHETLGHCYIMCHMELLLCTHSQLYMRVSAVYSLDAHSQLYMRASAVYSLNAHSPVQTNLPRSLTCLLEVSVSGPSGSTFKFLLLSICSSLLFCITWDYTT